MSLPSALDILNANISNVDISHVTLPPQIWKIEILKLWNLRFKIFAVYLCPLWTWRFECWHFPYYFVISNLKPWNLETLKTFTSNFCCLSLFSELDISNNNISHVDIFHVTLSRSLLIIKNEMYGFKTRNVPFSCTKNVAISNTERWPFQHFNFLFPEDTSAQATSAYIKCKYWMCWKVRMVKTTVLFICNELLGALIHLNIIILILICFNWWCLV